MFAHAQSGQSRNTEDLAPESRSPSTPQICFRSRRPANLIGVAALREGDAERIPHMISRPGTERVSAHSSAPTSQMMERPPEVWLRVNPGEALHGRKEAGALTKKGVNEGVPGY